MDALVNLRQETLLLGEFGKADWALHAALYIKKKAPASLHLLKTQVCGSEVSVVTMPVTSRKERSNLRVTCQQIVVI